MTQPLRPVRDEERQREEPPRELPRRRAHARWIVPLAVIGAAALAGALLMATRPAVETRRPEILAPLVRVVVAQPKSLRLDVTAEGTVHPRTESDLVAEVAGRVVALSPSMEEGGFFQADDVLIRLDDRDYRVALEKARAQVERAESESAWADRALERRRALAEEGVASASNLDDFENRARIARAELRDKRADLERARLDLERTALRAPYAGRVLEAHIDVGQFVARGTTLASLYAVDWAEVRLQVPDEALAHLGLPLDFHVLEADADAAPAVELSAKVAGRAARWRGSIQRAEGQVDPRSRMVTLVARVADPYGRQTPADVPLAAGLFVAARITGREAEGVYELPAVALRNGEQLLVVDSEDRLRFRPVEVLRRGDDTVVIAAGLHPGERVCVSPLEAVTDGMRVRVNPPAQASTGSG